MMLSREFFEWRGSIVLTLRTEHNFDMIAVGKGWYLENPKAAKSVEEFFLHAYEHKREPDEVVAEILRQTARNDAQKDQGPA